MSGNHKALNIPILLFGWWLFLGLTNFYWLGQDTVPPSHDPLNHLKSSLRYYHVLQGQDHSTGGLTALLNVDNYYPPLAPLAASVFYFLWPPDSDMATSILNQFFLALLLIAVYRLGTRLYSPEIGLLAAVVVTSFPIITTQSRMFMLDIPTTAMTAWAMYGLLRTENFQRLGASILFGLVAGFATLTKWTSLFFIFLPLISLVVQAFRTEDRIKRGKNILAAFAAWGLIILPWFTEHFSNLVVMSSKFGYAAAVKEGDPPVFTGQSFIYYVRVLPRDLNFLWLSLFLVGIFFYIRDDLRRSPIPLFWIVGGYAVLTLIRNKDPRYIMPFLPAVGLIAIGWFKNFHWKPWITRWGLIGLCLLTVMATYLASPPHREAWPLKEAFEFIQTQKSFHPLPRVRVIPDTAEFERHGFEYYSELTRYPLEVTTWVRFPTFTDFVVTKTGDQGFAHDPVEVMDAIQRDPEGFEAVFKKKWERPLPDGTAAQIYVRDITPVSGITPEAFIQRFEAALMRYLGPYVKEPRGWAIHVEPFSDQDTLSGRFRRVSFTMESALIQSKPNGRDSLAVRDLGMDLTDLTVNPLKLLRDGQFEIISLMEATPRFRVTQTDLNAYLSALKGAIHPTVEFKEGMLRIQSDSKGWIPRLDVVLEPDIVNEENIGYKFLEFHAGGLRLPSLIPQILTAKFNPALKPMPCRIHLRTLKIEHGEFILNG
jgi:hypothetical protein